jgi:cell division protein FtsL
MRQSTILFLIIAGVLGLGLFLLKYEVADLERKISSLNREIVQNREAVHVLGAEWSYLNEPSRLAKLASQHLGLKPVTPAQLGTLDSVPFPRGEAAPVGPLAQAGDNRRGR